MREKGIDVVYIKHNNLSPGTRTFKPDTKGAELVPELKIVSDKVFVKTKAIYFHLIRAISSPP